MKAFERAFGHPPAVVASAPGRVNLLGEHTDYNDGFVLPIAIQQRTWVALGPSPGSRFVLAAPDIGDRADFTLADAPSQQFARYVHGCLLEVASFAELPPALDILVSSQVPMGVGLSSSAALEVALLRALKELLGLRIDDVQIAEMAQRAESLHAGVRCGIMDQMASSLASTDAALFLDTRTLQTRRVALPAESEIVVLDSGVSRSLATSGYNQRRAECEEACRLLKLPSLREVPALQDLEALPPRLFRRARHVFTENARVLHAAEGLTAPEFGTLLNQSHASLRDDYEVSVPALDRVVRLLQAQSDVHGARLTGAGFGGACVALCGAGQGHRVATAVLEAYACEGGQGRLLVPAAESDMSDGG